MKQITNKENDWDHNVEGDAVEGPIDCIGRDKLVQALKEIRMEKTLDLLMHHWS